MTPRCLEPRCPCQTSPLWRDMTDDERDYWEIIRGRRDPWPWDGRPPRYTHPPGCRARS